MRRRSASSMAKPATREAFKGESLEGIPSEDGRRFIKGPMARRPTATQIIIVHRGEIIVHEAINVNEFHRSGCIIERFERSAECDA